jgi:hypothetical protein
MKNLGLWVIVSAFFSINTVFAVPLKPVSKDKLKLSICSEVAAKVSSGYFDESACLKGLFFQVSNSSWKPIVFSVRVPELGFSYQGLAIEGKWGPIYLLNLNKGSFPSVKCVQEFESKIIPSLFENVENSDSLKEMDFKAESLSYNTDSAGNITFDSTWSLGSRSKPYNFRSTYSLSSCQ